MKGPVGTHPLRPDLEAVVDRLGTSWDELKDARLFVTGGTGFVGSWLLETFLWARDRLGLRARATVLTRDPAGFRRKAPHLAGHPAVDFVQGDAVSFSFPEGRFTHVIHAAAEAGKPADGQDPVRIVSTAVEGTRRVLSLAAASGSHKFLFLSSGAVYGPQSPDLPRLSEDHPPVSYDDAFFSSYAEGKRRAESLCLEAAGVGLAVKIARAFAFIGPYLPLDGRFAAGQFLRDGLAGGPIRVHGDGTPVRSYLYASDLAAWLWKILFDGPSARPYNVGSETETDIAALAQAVAAACGPSVRVRVAGTPVPGRRPERYVPDVRRAATELGLSQTVSLEEAIRRTLKWHEETGT